MLRVTLDTNAVGPNIRAKVEKACAGLDVDVQPTTVTDRETAGTSFATSGASIPEVAVYGEGRYGQAVWAGDESVTRLESILQIIAGGTFPPPGERESLTAGQRRQMRDAIILETHTLAGRDVFVTEDVKGFIRGGRREQVEALCGTRIMSVAEFLAWLPSAVERT